MTFPPPASGPSGPSGTLADDSVDDHADPDIDPGTHRRGMTHLDPEQTYRFLEQHPDALWIDCRSEHEYFLVGHPIVERQGADPKRPEQVVWVDEITADLNPNFVAEVRQYATGPDQPVVVTCRSGRRSVQAAEALEADGFTRVINVLEGFEGPLDNQYRRGTTAGWRYRGLPWEQL